MIAGATINIIVAPLSKRYKEKIMIRDDKLIPVQNLTASTVSYIIPETNNVRRFSGQQLRKDITAGELRSLYGTKGGRVLIEDYLGIKDRELAQEFNISTDVFDHEYSWTQKEVDEVLQTGSLDALKDALEFGPEGIKQLIIDRAIELRIPDNNKLAAIQEFTGRDVGNMIKLDVELENPKEETPSRGTRRVVSNTGASQNQRRASE
jgi:hypothetical protein